MRRITLADSLYRPAVIASRRPLRTAVKAPDAFGPFLDKNLSPKSNRETISNCRFPDYTEPLPRPGVGTLPYSKGQDSSRDRLLWAQTFESCG